MKNQLKTYLWFLYLCYLFGYLNMTKTTVFTATVIICCVFLWLWFYFGRSSVIFDNTEEQQVSLFDRQKECNALYDQYKDKTKNYWEIDELSVFYSPMRDSCLASWMAWLDTDNDNISDIYRFFIVDALKWDFVILQCSVNVFEQDNNCWLQMFKKRRYELAN